MSCSECPKFRTLELCVLRAARTYTASGGIEEAAELHEAVDALIWAESDGDLAKRSLALKELKDDYRKVLEDVRIMFHDGWSTEEAREVLRRIDKALDP